MQVLGIEVACRAIHDNKKSEEFFMQNAEQRKKLTPRDGGAEKIGREMKFRTVKDELGEEGRGWHY